MALGSGLLAWLTLQDLRSGRGGSRQELKVQSGLLPQRLKEAASRGIPLSGEAFQPEPLKSKFDNAAPLLAALTKVLETKGAQAEAAAVAAETRDWPRLAQLKPAVAQAIEAARSASARPRLDWGRDWSKGALLSFAEHETLRMGVRLLLASSLAAFSQDDPDWGMVDLKCALRLSRLQEEEATMSSLLVQAVNDRRILSAVEAAAALSPPSRRGLLEAISSIRPAPLSRAARNEIYLRATLFLSPAYEEEMKLYRGIRGKPAPPLTSEDNYPGDHLTRAHLARWMEEGGEALDILDHGPLSSTKALALAQLDEKRRSKGGESWRRVRQYFPNFGAAADDLLTLEAAKVRARAYILLLLWQEKKGKIPSSLDEAGISAPDPFTGKAMKYVKRSKGFRLYSVARDREDNGGITKEEAKKQGLPPASSDAVTIHGGV